MDAGGERVETAGTLDDSCAEMWGGQGTRPGLGAGPLAWPGRAKDMASGGFSAAETRRESRGSICCSYRLGAKPGFPVRGIGMPLQTPGWRPKLMVFA